MNEIDIPILKKSYDLYKVFHDYRKIIPKAERFTVYERSENLIVDMMELFLEAGYTRSNKVVTLEKASVKLNTLRFFVRLMKETKSLDLKKYTILQEMIDEIGRMLGGWIRSSSNK